jgi:hypothetical protein
MKDFIDLPGASGASYRFRFWPEGRPHQPIAGNYVCVRADPGEAGAYEVVHVGESTDLSRVRAELPKALRAAGMLVFTRLNIARAARTAEHEDLLARHARGERRRGARKRAPNEPA